MSGISGDDEEQPASNSAGILVSKKTKHDLEA